MRPPRGFSTGTVSSSPCTAYGGSNLCGASDTAVAAQDLRCAGGELNIDECTWSAPGSACTSHELDSVVYCSSGPSIVEGSARLLSDDGAPSLDGNGLPEVYVAGAWSPLCNINAAAASVLCKSMGFSGRGTVTGVGRARSPPNVGSLECQGNEASVMSCFFEVGGDVYCALSEASAVSCA